MTRKDFQVIAEIIGGLIYSQECLGVDIWKCKGMVDSYLRQTNPNYNPDRFWKAVNKEILIAKGITS